VVKTLTPRPATAELHLPISDTQGGGYLTGRNRPLRWRVVLRETAVRIGSRLFLFAITPNLGDIRLRFDDYGVSFFAILPKE
jgi:hypothetical protein